MDANYWSIRNEEYFKMLKELEKIYLPCDANVDENKINKEVLNLALEVALEIHNEVKDPFVFTSQVDDLVKKMEKDEFF